MCCPKLQSFWSQKCFELFQKKVLLAAKRGKAAMGSFLSIFVRGKQIFVKPLPIAIYYHCLIARYSTVVEIVRDQKRGKFEFQIEQKREKGERVRNVCFEMQKSKMPRELQRKGRHHAIKSKLLACYHLTLHKNGIKRKHKLHKCMLVF